ncbi:Uncharacterized protein dnm_053050 [Desulfonema magnum]|uniref:Uncharacterized protein n=1 Tax=Desulfonema magnum TaxID=45655 RepID=A0A975BPK6_9BACT|nr:Uncharacterized protein dnm_053050 [Desulfonema magnum]
MRIIKGCKNSASLRLISAFRINYQFSNFLIITELGEAGNMTTDSGDETDSTGRYDSGSPKGVSDPESPIPYPGRQPVIRCRGKPIYKTAGRGLQPRPKRLFSGVGKYFGRGCKPRPADRKNRTRSLVSIPSMSGSLVNKAVEPKVKKKSFNPLHFRVFGQLKPEKSHHLHVSIPSISGSLVNLYTI